MAKVYIPHPDGRYDTRDATRYGKIVILSMPEMYPDDAAEKMEVTLRTTSEQLQYFNAAEDFLCLTGSPLAVAISVFILCKFCSRINLLRYDRLENAYYQIVMDGLHI